MTTKKVFFRMPEDGELFLAALAAIQHYIEVQVGTARIYKTELDMDVVIQTSRSWTLHLFKALYMDTRVRVSINTIPGPFDYTYFPKRSSFDLVYDYNCSSLETWRRYTAPSNMHLSTALGFMIGSDPEDTPNLKMLPKVEARIAATFIYTESSQQLAPIVEEVILSRGEVSLVGSTGTLSEEHCRKILEGEVIIGHRSPETYFAASVGRPVVELYPEDCHPRFLSKHNNKQYMQLYGRANWTREKIHRALEMIWAASMVAS
jgi:hypothetical protein